jgi:hypothetical protein
LDIHGTKELKMKMRRFAASLLFAGLLLANISALTAFDETMTANVSTADITGKKGGMVLRKAQWDPVTGELLGCWGSGLNCWVIPLTFTDKELTISSDGIGLQ